MNLDDLTEELTARAEADVPPSGGLNTTTRLAGVRYRAQVRRRRRTWIAVAAAAVLVAGIAWHPALPGIGVHAQVPAGQEPQVFDPMDMVFPPRDGDDPRISVTQAPEGATELVLRFTPSTGNIRLDTLCAQSRNDDAELISTAIWVNGIPTQLGTACAAGSYGHRSFAFDDDPGRNAREWAKFGVRPGRNSDVTIRYINPAVPNQLQLALAVYELTGERVMAGDHPLPRTKGSGVDRVKLVDWAGRRLSAGREPLNLEQPILPGDTVCAGTTDSIGVGAAGKDRIRVNRKVYQPVSAGGTGCFQIFETDVTSVDIVPATGSRGTVFIALYRPAGR